MAQRPSGRSTSALLVAGLPGREGYKHGQGQTFSRGAHDGGNGVNGSLSTRAVSRRGTVILGRFCLEEMGRASMCMAREYRQFSGRQCSVLLLLLPVLVRVSF